MFKSPESLPSVTDLDEARRRRTIAIIGSGVVGTATGRGFAAKGHDVVFCDIALDRIAALRKQGLKAVDAGGLIGRYRDAYLISVPSPTIDGRVDLSYVAAAAETVGQAIEGHPGRPLVVTRSTVPPGTTEGLVRDEVERESGLLAGVDFGLCMNPEFLRAVSAEQDFLEPRVIVIGALDEHSDRQLRELYAPWADVPVSSMSILSAEVTKYVSNLFNATKISFFNEMEQICQELGADARAAFSAVGLGCEGLWNPEYGTRGLYPYGGACLPKDTVGFLGFAEDGGLSDAMLMLQATIETNERLVERQGTEAAPVERQAQAS